MNIPPQKSGGAGGSAEVVGDDSRATGGTGGDAVQGNGGQGGNARVHGNRSTAVGGKGGRGGVGPGQPGGDVTVLGDDAFAAGGQGGEASQHDGRGGRGGRAFNVCNFFGLSDRGHIKPPYGQQHTEPGRGGDAPDSPQYMARKLTIMALKERYFIEKQIEPRDSETVWYDRTVVPMEWLNETLVLRGYKWRVGVVDCEYEFSDETQPTSTM